MPPLPRLSPTRLIALLLACLLLTRAVPFASALARNWTSPAVAHVYAISSVWPGPPCGANAGASKPAAAPRPDATVIDLQAQARVLWLQGQCAQALSTWRTALGGDPGLPSPAAFDLGRALYSQGDNAGSVAALRPSGALNYLAAIAEREPFLGQAAAARDVYDWVLNVNPLPESAGVPAKAYTPATQLALAINTWQLVADAAPVTGALHWQAVAETARLQQHWTDSRNAFEQALAVAAAGERYDLLLRQGRLLGEMHDWPAALAAYGQAVQLQPAASTEPYVAAGLIEVAQGNYQPGLAWFDRALAVLPGDPWPNVYAGNTALAFHDPVEAERRYRLALTQSRGHFGALYYYGLFLLGQGRPREAIAVLQPIESSGDCNVLAALRDSYRALGQPAQAARIGAQITDQCPA